ncbi:MAG: hypothetical protein KKA07_00840, partial [Bacteroidetes bacterium]|nr:hypothetical protein [Bacteroidota bacterium]
MKRIQLLTIVLAHIINMHCIACNNRNGNFNITEKKEKAKGTPILESIKDSIIDLELICQYKTGESEFFETENEFPASPCLYYGELFLLNQSDRKIAILDIEKKTTRTDTNVNKIIEQYSDEYSGARQIIVNDKYYFIGFLRSVLCVSKEGLLIGKTTTEVNINNFTTYENSIVVFTNDEIIQFDFFGKKLLSRVLENTLSGHFLNIENEICVSEYNELTYLNIEPFAKISYHKTKIPLTNFPFKVPYLAFVTSAQTIWYPYMTRDQIVFLDRETNNPEIRYIFNKINFAPTED